MESAATSCALRTDSDAFWSWLGEAVAQTTVAANRNHTAQGDFIFSFYVHSKMTFRLKSEEFIEQKVEVGDRSWG